MIILGPIGSLFTLLVEVYSPSLKTHSSGGRRQFEVLLTDITWGFSTDKLVLILQLLLKEQIFDGAAQDAFPELFENFSPKQKQQTVIQKQPTAGRQALGHQARNRPGFFRAPSIPDRICIRRSKWR
jgi:hypothetical protein